MPVLSALQSAALAIPGFLRLGHLQLPVFGIIATAGLIAALTLSQRTAASAGLDPQRLWDAGIVAVLSAFLASRLLLVLVNIRLFFRQPLLVLVQPSLTVGGLALAALIVWFWLRRHRLPLRRVLDAWAAPAALLAAILQLGHFVEGTGAGMPTTLPWGVHTPGDLTFARVHPVQLYAAGAYLALCFTLLQFPKQRVSPRRSFRGFGESAISLVLLRARLQPCRKASADATALAAEVSPSEPTPGRTAALGLVLGGFLSFGLSFLRQPYAAFGSAWLDPAQWTALAAMLLGSALWIFGIFVLPEGEPKQFSAAGLQTCQEAARAKS